MVLIYENKDKLSHPAGDKKTKPEKSAEVQPDVSEIEESEGALAPVVAQLLENYKKELIASRREYTPIHVDEIASRLSKFYEKIRKVVDWKDDNALRRNAIERVLKRVLFPKVTGITPAEIRTEDLAKVITMDLIRAGHLPNDAVPREKIEILASALSKYTVFLENVNSYKTFEVKERINYTTFILEIASCEIEEVLTDPFKEYGVIDAMTKTMDERITVVTKEPVSPEFKRMQVFVATCRALYDLDDNFIIYRLLSNTTPGWSNMTKDEAHKLSKRLPELWARYTLEINLPISHKILRICRKIDTIFILIDDILEKLKAKPKELQGVFENKEKFTEIVKEQYEARYSTLKTRLFRLAMFSTLSVFLSNWVTFYIVEVPLAKLFYEGFNWVATVVDFLVPTIVMFLMVAFIRPPGPENAEKVVNSVLGFIYKDEKKEKFQITLSSKRPSLFRIFMLALYIETILVVFGLIAYVFYIARLPITSVIFDTFTIALTVFAAVGIKNKSLELNVDEHTSVKDFILDTISVPIARVGAFLARKWKEYNIIAIFFNFVIETPFSILLDFIQGWSEYIKERREEIL